MKPKAIEFSGVIRQNGNMNAAFVEFPFSVNELFGKNGQVRVKVVFDEKSRISRKPCQNEI